MAGDVVMTESTQGSGPLCSLCNISGAHRRTISHLTLGRTCKQVCFILKQILHVLFTALDGTELNWGFLLHLSLDPLLFLGLGSLAVKIKRQHWWLFISALPFHDFAILCLIYRPRRKSFFQ